MINTLVLRGFILSLTLLANTAFAMPNVLELIKNMSHSARAQNYQANLVLFEDNKITSLMVEHRARDGGIREWERLVSLQGVKQETVVDGTRMLLLLPNGKRDRVLRNPLADTFLNLHKSLQKYNVSFIGEDRVASRPSYVLQIKAKDKYHYSYILWLDKESGIYLRAQWLDSNDKVQSEAMFNSIKFKNPNNSIANSTRPMPRMSVVKKTTAPDVSDNAKSKARITDSSMIKIDWLPTGFSLLHKLTHPPEGPGQTEHLVFGDGTVKISVYTSLLNKLSTQGPIDLGRTCGFALDLKDKHITVLGEMPVLTLKKIARSIVSK